MLLSLSNINYKTFLINLLFSLIPISFLAGNLILNINILLFIIFTIIFYGKVAYTYYDKSYTFSPFNSVLLSIKKVAHNFHLQICKAYKMIFAIYM